MRVGRLSARRPDKLLKANLDPNHVAAFIVQSRNVMAYCWRRHRGKRYGPISSRERQDHARRSSRATAIEGSGRGTREAIRQISEAKPQIFNRSPSHDMLGLNT
jgi:hypothetical protein